MSYNPYANSVDSIAQNRIHHPQPQAAPAAYHNPQEQSTQQRPQHQQQQQYGSYQQTTFPQQGVFHPQQQQQPQFGATAYNDFFSDPRAAMTLQAGQGAFKVGSHFVEENFQKMVGSKAINYYFKVSNSYVLSKLLLILFPFRNKNWARNYRTSDDGGSDVSNGAPTYAFPLDDKNAPDLYIPLMGSITYILTLALIAGLRDQFTPQVFGTETSTSLLALILDFGVLKLGLYLLNITSTNWDLIAYIGYKFVPIILILLVKNISNWRALNWTVYLYLVLSFAFFELRAIRFNLFGGIANSAQTLNNKSLKNTNYFLFVYAFLFQGALLWWLSK